MTKPHKSADRGGAVLRGPWTSVAAANLPRDTRTLHIDGEVEDLAGILDLPNLSILELTRWTRSIEPLAEHPAVTSLTIAETGGFGPPGTLAHLPALEHLSIRVREDDTPRVPGLLDKIPWRAMRRLRSFGIGVDGWRSAPLASHDLGFLADLEHVWHASPVGTVIDGAPDALSPERIPTALRELRLIERADDQLADAAARLEVRGISVLIFGQADVIPALPWPSPHPAELHDLSDEAVYLEDTDDGWQLVVLASGLPADWTTSMFRDRLVERVKPSADVMVDAEGDQVTVLGKARGEGRRFEAAADAIVGEIWGT